mgnify:CR=1 FL=1
MFSSAPSQPTAASPFMMANLLQAQQQSRKRSADHMTSDLTSAAVMSAAVRGDAVTSTPVLNRSSKSADQLEISSTSSHDGKILLLLWLPHQPSSLLALFSHNRSKKQDQNFNKF